MLIEIAPKEFKSYSAKFNASRYNDSSNFRQEIAYFEQAILNAQPDSQGRNKALEAAKANPESAMQVVIEAASLGLTWHPKMGHCYPVPYGGRLTLNIGYQGLAHILFSAKILTSIQEGLACANDPTFRVWTDDSGTHIQHEHARGERGEITAAYVISNLTNGDRHVEVMYRKDLDAVKEAAQTQKVWKGPFASQMMIKSCFRRAWKFLPKDSGGLIARALEVMDRNEPMDFEGWQPKIEGVALEELRAKMIEAGANEQQFLKFFGAPSLEQLPVSEFDRANKLLDQKISRKVKELA